MTALSSYPSEQMTSLVATSFLHDVLFGCFFVDGHFVCLVDWAGLGLGRDETYEIIEMRFWEERERRGEARKKGDNYIHAYVFG